MRGGHGSRSGGESEAKERNIQGTGGSCLAMSWHGEICNLVRGTSDWNFTGKRVYCKE
jgi:hypothetical protein